MNQIRNTLLSVCCFTVRADTAPTAKLTVDMLQELSSITDQRVELSLRSLDAMAGKWVQEDPPLHIVQALLGPGNS